MTRFILPGLTLLAFLGHSSALVAQDAKGAAAAQKIAAEQIASRVRDTIDNSRKVDSIEAKIALNRMRRQVENSTDLFERERTPLLRQLDQRLSQVDAASRGTGAGIGSKSPPRDLDTPKYKLPVNNPGSGPSEVASRFRDSAKKASDAHAELIQRREKGNLAIGLEREKFAVVVNADPISFPSYWKELTKRRKETVDQKMTEKEVAVLKALNSTMSVNYDGEKFKGVIGHLQDKTGLTIVIDEASLRDANVDYEADTVSFKIEKASVRFILKKVLGDKGLTYIIKEGAIQVMSPKKASEFTVTKTYQIDDLIAPSPQAQMMFGPFVAQMQMQQNAQQLANLIASTVSPDYWQPNGPGSITFFAPTKSLIIRASAEMHYQLASPGLFGGR